jgi:hypothetical protein
MVFFMSVSPLVCYPAPSGIGFFAALMPRVCLELSEKSVRLTHWAYHNRGNKRWDRGSPGVESRAAGCWPSSGARVRDCAILSARIMDAFLIATAVAALLVALLAIVTTIRRRSRASQGERQAARRE